MSLLVRLMLSTLIVSAVDRSSGPDRPLQSRPLKVSPRVQGANASGRSDQ